jgi:hypothetical protein
MGNKPFSDTEDSGDEKIRVPTDISQRWITLVTEKKLEEAYNAVLEFFPENKRRHGELLCPFPGCDMSNKSSKIKGHLLKVHVKYYKFSCSMCQARFLFENQLNRHQREKHHGTYIFIPPLLFFQLKSFSFFLFFSFVFLIASTASMPEGDLNRSTSEPPPPENLSSDITGKQVTELPSTFADNEDFGQSLDDQGQDLRSNVTIFLFTLFSSLCFSLLLFTIPP